MEALNIVTSGKCHVEDEQPIGVIGLKARTEPVKEFRLVQNDTIYQTQIPIKMTSNFPAGVAKLGAKHRCPVATVFAWNFVRFQQVIFDSLCFRAAVDRF